MFAVAYYGLFLTFVALPVGAYCHLVERNNNNNESENNNEH